MSFEQLQNIIDWNKEQAELHLVDEDLENNLCPYCCWNLDTNDKGVAACPICGRIYK